MDWSSFKMKELLTRTWVVLVAAPQRKGARRRRRKVFPREQEEDVILIVLLLWWLEMWEVRAVWPLSVPHRRGD